MTPPALDFRNTNSLWCSVIAEAFARAGVRQVVTSPGSRSTPLTFAFARHAQIEAVPVLDERSAAFFALGLARQAGRPVALVCTSGTAAANYLPAVVEARESGVPLVVLTADRPPELRECAAGQTIDQQKLYGGFVNFYHELATPKAELGMLRYLRQTVLHAIERAQVPSAGPVHLNVPFRDPLPPIEDGVAGKLEAEFDADGFFSGVEPPAGCSWAAPTFAPPATARGVIIAGPAQPGNPGAHAAAVRRLSASLGWPVLADGINPLRHRAGDDELLITNYPAMLRSAALAERLRPEAVLCVGDWPTAKLLRQWLEKGAADTWMVAADPRNHDGLHGRTRHLRCSVEALAAGLPPGKRPAGAYAEEWRRADMAAGAALESRIDGAAFPSEPGIVRLLACRLPPGTPLFVASSMPVRDIECFWPAGGRGVRPYFNRGANGIDGTLSTAFGIAHGGQPAALLTGDLALLHDSNGFLLRPRFRGSLTIVLINNRGGGIFEMLPVAKFDPPFEEYFATPQEVDFARLCAAHGVEHVLVRGREHLAGLVGALPAAGVRVLEVRTDRKRETALRRELMLEASKAAEAAVLNR